MFWVSKAIVKVEQALSHRIIIIWQLKLNNMFWVSELYFLFVGFECYAFWTKCCFKIELRLKKYFDMNDNNFLRNIILSIGLTIKVTFLSFFHYAISVQFIFLRVSTWTVAFFFYSKYNYRICTCHRNLNCYALCCPHSVKSYTVPLLQSSYITHY